MSVTLRVLRRLFGGLLRIYFREVELVGPAPGPGTRGRLFVANHPNALIDPILVLTLVDCPISPVAKSTLFEIPGLRLLLDVAGAVPVVRRRDVPGKSAADNDAIFDKVGAHLARGGNVLIFPEGTSHSEPRLLPLKTGAARMLARARAIDPSAPLEFQAVGLVFDDKATFRSRALVAYGPVRAVAELDATGIERTTAEIAAELEEILVTGGTAEVRRRIYRAAEILAHEEGGRTLAEFHALGRSVEAAKQLIRRPATLERVSAALDAYGAHLERAGLTDEDVARPDRLLPGRKRRRLGGLALAPLGALGIVLWAPPYHAIRLILARLRGDLDEVSTKKLGLGLVLFPLWAIALTVGLALSGARLGLGGAAIAAVVAVALASPFAAVSLLDALPRAAARLGGADLETAAALRAEALAALEAARRELSDS